MQKHLEFVISSEFLVVRLQQIVPLNKVQCFWPYGNTNPSEQVLNPVLCCALDSAY